VTSEARFAAKLRQWRERRGYSQLELAGRAGTSQRHLSFLELGRASPSRAMVNRLAAALDIPLRQHNALLLSAGFAPRVAPARPRGAGPGRGDERARLHAGPTGAVSGRRNRRHWNLLRSNAGAVRLVEFLVGPIAPGTVINLADALVAPDVLRPHLTNWAQVMRHFIRNGEADAAADGSIETMALLERLMGYQGVRNALRPGSNSAHTGPVLAMHFYKDDASLRLFTTIATLGTPQEVTLQELRIECFFPMDDATAKLLQSWARSP
jgi:transcriptional regulator with XRE-family HTH domain